MDDSAFETTANHTLARLMETIEAAIGDVADVDLDGGILTIELDAGGTYVINKHAPNRQIWLSSPASGASHFDHDPARGWVSTKGGAELEAMLADELAATTGATVAFD